MRNRETIKKLLERIESKTSIIHMMVNRRDNPTSINAEIDIVKELITEIDSFIEQEPMSPNEYNKY